MHISKSSVRPKSGPKRDLRPAGAFVLAVSGVLGLALSAAQQAHAAEAPYTLVAWDIVAGHGHELDTDQRFIASAPGATSLSALDGVLATQACGEYVQLDLYRNVDGSGAPVSSLWSTGWLNPDRDGSFLAYDLLPTPYETKEIAPCQTTVPTSSPTPSASPSPTGEPSASPTATPSDSPAPSSTPTDAPTENCYLLPACAPTPSPSAPPTGPTPTAATTPPSRTPSGVPALGSPSRASSSSSAPVSAASVAAATTPTGTSSPTATELASTGPGAWLPAAWMLSLLAMGLGVTALVLLQIRRTNGRRKGAQR